MKKIKKIGGIVFEIVIFAVFIISACVTIISLSTSEHGVPSVGGYVLLNIKTNSMADYINKGDMIITEKVKDTKKLKKDDVIAFFAVEQGQTIVKTHRIVNIENANGVLIFTTKGDNNEVADSATVSSSDIISVYSGKKVPVLGDILNFMQSRTGFFICVVIPLFCIFVYQMYRFVTEVVESKNAKKIKA